MEWCRGEGSTEGKEEESEKVREGGGREGSDKPEEVAGWKALGDPAGREEVAMGGNRIA